MKNEKPPDIVKMVFPTRPIYHESEEALDIDLASVQLTEKAVEISKLQAVNVKKATEKANKLDEINSKIYALTIERDMIVSQLETASQDAVLSLLMFNLDSASKLVAEFEKKGFTNKVRTAVKNVRDMLFDDNVNEFRNIVCNRILIDYMYIGFNSVACLRFEFEHIQSGNCFAICFPIESVLNYRKRRYNKYLNINSNVNIFGISVIFPESSHSYRTIIFHYDIRIVRKQLDNFVKRGCLPLPEPILNHECEEYFNIQDDMYFE